ncbi:MAG: hypothetical protein LBK95_16640 [Bifidobacteriaceae bacterium]|nr:hypothetical protein [Bifidobacteriaceae bacterium]
MIAELILAVASLGVGFASAFFPPVNAELLTLAAVAATTTTLRGAVATVVSVTVGQTIGKIIVYEATRAGRDLAQRRLDQTAAGVLGASSLADPVARADRSGGRFIGRLTSPFRRGVRRPGRSHPRWDAFKAWLKRWSDRGLALMNTRGRCLAVLSVSATVGFPPLLLTTVAAGAVKMNRFDFVAVTLVGRLIRFGAVAWPALALRF